MEETKRETIAINGIEYYVDSISKEAKQMIIDAQTIGTRMQELQRDINIMNIAKQSIVKTLINLADGFEKVEEPKQEESVEKTAE